MSDIQAILDSDLDAESKKALVEKALDNQKAAAPVAVLETVETPAEEAGEGKAGAAPQEETPRAGRPPYSKSPAYKFTPAAQAAEEDEAEQKSFNVFYQSRFGEESAAQKAIMSDLLGSNYRQFLFDQDMAYAKFLRRGERGLTDEDRKALDVQIFPIPTILKSVGEGISLAEIKATMVEAQGELGGYAVPPMRQENFIVRLRGTTAVRGGGAVVVTLTNGNSTEIPVYSGGNDQYVGALRGEWGSETQTPSEKNATMELVTVNANIYTYKVPMSQSLLEDAANLVSLVQNDIVDTAAIDEDIAFLTGIGGQQPHGILPGGLNAYAISEVVSGAAAALTADGLIGLSDEIADQYIDGSRWVFRRTTGTAIRKLKDNDNNYLFDRDLENNKRTLLGFPYFRTDSMPAVAANAYPVLFGHLSAYYIVERMGMTIQRFQDSGTGPNKVEFHVRRRVGGRLSAPFKLAVQKVST